MPWIPGSVTIDVTALAGTMNAGGFENGGGSASAPHESASGGLHSGADSDAHDVANPRTAKARARFVPCASPTSSPQSLARTEPAQCTRACFDRAAGRPYTTTRFTMTRNNT